MIDTDIHPGAMLNPLLYCYATGKPRSGHWPSLRGHILGLQPWCTCCGSKHNLTVHHMKPFHLHPELELEPKNLVVLCEGFQGHLAELNCHFVFGHLGDWKKFNPEVMTATEYMRGLVDAQAKDHKPLFPGKFADEQR